MNDSSKNQKPKYDQRDPKEKAITSFLLGIIIFIPPLLFLLFYLIAGLMAELGYDNIADIIGEKLSHTIIFIYPLPLVAILSSLTGLTIGIPGLRSTKKKIAIAGIIINTIVFIASILGSIIIILGLLTWNP